MIEDQKHQKSRGYPQIGLKEAVVCLGKLKDNAGPGPYSRDTVISGIGHAPGSGAGGVKVGAMGHFGLLHVRKGKEYRVSNMGKRVISPVTPDEKSSALVEAVKCPALFSQLIAKFSGHAIPPLLPNILEREFGILHGKARKAAEVFKESLEYAGLLVNGVLQETSVSVPSTEVEPEPVDSSDVGSEGIGSQESAAPRVSPPAPSASVYGTVLTPTPGSESLSIRFQVPLSRARNAFLLIPEPLDDRDFAKIISWMEANADNLEMKMPETSGN